MKSLFRCCCRNRVAPKGKQSANDFSEDEDELVIEEVIEMATTLKQLEEGKEGKGTENQRRTFKSVSQLIRSAVIAAKDASVKRTITLKSVAKAAKIGAATTLHLKREKARKKKRMLNALLNLIRFRNAQKAHPIELKRRKTFKSIGRLTRLIYVHKNDCPMEKKRVLGFKFLARLSRFGGIKRDDVCTCCQECNEWQLTELGVDKDKWAMESARGRMNAPVAKEKPERKKIFRKLLRLLRLGAVPSTKKSIEEENVEGVQTTESGEEEDPSVAKVKTERKKKIFSKLLRLLRLGAVPSTKKSIEEENVVGVQTTESGGEEDPTVAKVRTERKKKIFSKLLRLLRLGAVPTSKKPIEGNPMEKSAIESTEEEPVKASSESAAVAEKREKKRLLLRFLLRVLRLRRVSTTQPVEEENSERTQKEIKTIEVGTSADPSAANVKPERKKKIFGKLLRLLRMGTVPTLKKPIEEENPIQMKKSALESAEEEPVQNNSTEEEKRFILLRLLLRVLRLRRAKNAMEEENTVESGDEKPRKRKPSFKVIGKILRLNRPGEAPISGIEEEATNTKPKTFKRLGRLLRLGISAKPRKIKRKKSMWTMGKMIGLGKINRKKNVPSDDSGEEVEEVGGEPKKKWYQKYREEKDEKEMFKLVANTLKTPPKKTEQELAEDRKRTWRTLAQVVLLGTKGIRPRAYFATKKKKIWRKIGRVVVLGGGAKRRLSISPPRPRRIKTFKALVQLFIAAASKMKVKRSQRRLTFKGLGKLTRLGLFGKKKARSPKRKVSFKAVGKLSRLGPNKPPVAKPISQFVNRKVKFKTVANLTRIVASEEPVCTCEPIGSNEILVCTCPFD